MTSVPKLLTLLLAAAMALLSSNMVNAQLDCNALSAREPCMRPSDTTNATGQFICRRRYINGLQRVDYQTLCIPTTWGKAGDRCGCCNGNCPNFCTELCPAPAGIGIPLNGQFLGSYVYDWNSNTPKRMCVSPGRSLQLQQQNPAKWRCVEKQRWFSNRPRYNDDGSWDAWGSVVGGGN